MRYLTGDTPHRHPKMSVAGYRIRLLKRKDNQMLSLNYTIEKEGISLSEINKLMISESQINDLMDTLVANGYTVESMSVASATL